MKHYLSRPNVVGNLLLGAIALAAFGSWLLIDVIPNEDLIFTTQLEQGNLRAIWLNVSWHNAHAAMLPYSMLGIFGSPVMTARVLSLLCVWISGICVFHLVRLATGWGRRDAMWVAALSMVWPGYMLQFAVSLFSYPFYLAAFLFGMLLIFRAKLNKEPKATIFIVAGSFIVLTSFVVNSLLVFYYAVLLGHYAMSIRLERAKAGWSHLAAYSARNVFVITLPLLYWTSRLGYAALFGVDPGYNEFVLNYRSVVISAITFGRAIWYATLPDDALELGTALLGAFVGFLVVARASWRRGKRRAVKTDRNLPMVLLAAGVLLVAAIVPYVLVGKAPGSPGFEDRSHWYTRHLLLAGIPCSLLVVSLAKLLDQLLAGLGRISVGMALMAGLTLSYGADRIRHGLRYQLLGIQDRALMRLLQENPLAWRTHVYGISSKVSGFTYEIKPHYTWPYFMQRTFGGAIDRYVFEEEPGMPPNYYQSKLYPEHEVAAIAASWHLADRGLKGYEPPPNVRPQVSIVVDGGISQTNEPVRVVLKYWLLRMSDSKELSGFISSAISARLLEKDMGSPSEASK